MVTDTSSMRAINHAVTMHMHVLYCQCNVLSFLGHVSTAVMSTQPRQWLQVWHVHRCITNCTHAKCACNALLHTIFHRLERFRVQDEVVEVPKGSLGGWQQNSSIWWKEHSSG